VKHDPAEMEARLHRFDRSLRAVDGVAEALIPVIHRPGWTTPAEFAFFNSFLEAMTGQVAVLAQMRERLIESAKTVAVAQDNPLFTPVPPDHTRL